MHTKINTIIIIILSAHSKLVKKLEFTKKELEMNKKKLKTTEEQLKTSEGQLELSKRESEMVNELEMKRKMCHTRDKLISKLLNDYEMLQEKLKGQ